MVKQPPSYEPTPDQIASACEDIRKEWTAAERQRRMPSGKATGAACRVVRINRDAMIEAMQ